LCIYFIWVRDRIAKVISINHENYIQNHYRLQLAVYAQTPEQLFAQKCVALTGSTVVVSGVTYTIQNAYVWGISCYVVSLEGIPYPTETYDFCLSINAEMHPAYLQTPAEFAAVDNSTNHVGICVLFVSEVVCAANSCGNVWT
jgi:hypothetical protein